MFNYAYGSTTPGGPDTFVYGMMNLLVIIVFVRLFYGYFVGSSSSEYSFITPRVNGGAASLGQGLIQLALMASLIFIVLSPAKVVVEEIPISARGSESDAAKPTYSTYYIPSVVKTSLMLTGQLIAAMLDGDTSVALDISASKQAENRKKIREAMIMSELARSSMCDKNNNIFGFNIANFLEDSRVLKHGNAIMEDGFVDVERVFNVTNRIAAADGGIIAWIKKKTGGSPEIVKDKLCMVPAGNPGTQYDDVNGTNSFSFLVAVDSLFHSSDVSRYYSDFSGSIIDYIPKTPGGGWKSTLLSVATMTPEVSYSKTAKNDLYSAITRLNEDLLGGTSVVGKDSFYASPTASFLAAINMVAKGASPYYFDMVGGAPVERIYMGRVGMQYPDDRLSAKDEKSLVGTGLDIGFRPDFFGALDKDMVREKVFPYSDYLMGYTKTKGGEDECFNTYAVDQSMGSSDIASSTAEAKMHRRLSGIINTGENRNIRTVEASIRGVLKSTSDPYYSRGGKSTKNFPGEFKFKDGQLKDLSARLAKMKANFVCNNVFSDIVSGSTGVFVSGYAKNCLIDLYTAIDTVKLSTSAESPSCTGSGLGDAGASGASSGVAGLSKTWFGKGGVLETLLSGGSVSDVSGTITDGSVSANRAAMEAFVREYLYLDLSSIKSMSGYSGDFMSSLRVRSGKSPGTAPKESGGSSVPGMPSFGEMVISSIGYVSIGIGILLGFFGMVSIIELMFGASVGFAKEVVLGNYAASFSIGFVKPLVSLITMAIPGLFFGYIIVAIYTMVMGGS